jgi:hypothetical protein
LNGRFELFGVDAIGKIFHRLQASANTWAASS